jgi:tyrosinase
MLSFWELQAIFKVAILCLALCFGYSLAYRDPKDGVYVRKNAKNMTDKEWDSIKRGIQVMMNLNEMDSRGYMYQANIHGWSNHIGNESMSDKYSWHKCQHGHYLFLPWHRMYLYYFERILRQAANDSELTIPYWDYLDGIPEPFRIPSNESNPLYKGNRCHAVNDGTALPRNIVDYEAALDKIHFTANKVDNDPLCAHDSFGGVRSNKHKFEGEGFGALETLPHNQIHLYLGGFVADSCKASQDPIFWLHHTQIDRLWETWLSLSEGRQNPTNEKEWMVQNFNFFDESGARTNIRVVDVLYTEEQLNYRYDKLAPTSHQRREEPRKIRIKRPSKAILFAALKSTEVDIGPSQNTVTLFVKPEARQILKKSSKDNVMFALRLNFTTMTRDLIYDVYIDLPNGSKYDEKYPYYVGPMANLACDADPKETNTKCFDVTSNYNKISKGKFADIFTVNVSFNSVPCGTGRLIPGDVWMKFHELNLVAVIEEREKKNSDKIKLIFRFSISILVTFSLLVLLIFYLINVFFKKNKKRSNGEDSPLIPKKPNST